MYQKLKVVPMPVHLAGSYRPGHVAKAATGKIVVVPGPPRVHARVFGAMTANVTANAQTRKHSDAIAKGAGPTSAAKIQKQHLRAVRSSLLSEKSYVLKANPPKPDIDLSTGRRTYATAFSKTVFHAPFQKSYHGTLGYGA